MKKTILLSVIALAVIPAIAQQRQQDRANKEMLTFPVVSTRTEIVLPDVNGYKVIKADFHVHTIYSDGQVTSSYRIIEGWQDGLDAIALTDHIEVRPNVSSYIDYLDRGIKKQETKKGEITVNLNTSVDCGKSRATKLGITLIPGTEITRDPVEIGHFNALFTTDNNLIPNPDPLQAVRNAKAQGAIVQINHPGWARVNNDFTETAQQAIKEGLIDGVEVFNSYEFYPNSIERAIENGLYVSCGSDMHPVSHDKYGRYGMFRDMTLVLAKDSSLESIREALEHQRTLAYAYGDIAGSEQLLKDFFKAAVSFEVVYTDSNGGKHVKITNNSSFPYILTLPGKSVDITLDGFTSVISYIKGNSIDITVQNMWFGDQKHPSLSIVPAE